MSTALEVPYVDGWYGEEVELTKVPRVKTPFKTNPNRQDTYSREYERDYEVRPRSFVSKLPNRTAWTNLLTYSESFSNAAWTKTNLTASSNQGTAPDGNSTLGKVLETVTNGEHSLTQAATVTAVPFEASIFIKGGLTRTRIRLAFIDSAATTFSAFFNTSGAVDTISAGVTAKVERPGNGDVRCVIRFTPASGAGTFKVNVATAGSTISYAGTTTNGVYVWGAQLTAGSQTPYIGTTDAARSILAPDRDKEDPFAYLMWEEDPSNETSETAKITRRFGRIPLTQTMPGSRTIPKPTISGTFPRVINGVLVDKPDENVDEYTFFSQVAVTGDTGAPTFGITGGDYDLTFGADTEAGIAHNANAATLETALNALASLSVRNGVEVTGGPSQFNIAFNAWPTSSIDGSGLTVSGGTPSFVVSYETPGGSPDPFRRWVRFRSNHGYTTAGTLTLTLLGETTDAIAFDATRQTFEDEINELSVIGSGAVVTVSNAPLDYSGKPLSTTQASIDFYVMLPMPTTSTADTFTPSGSATLTEAIGTLNGVPGLGWTLTLIGGTSGTRTITAASHGISATDDIKVTAGGVVHTLFAGSFSVPSASTIQFTSSSGTIFYGPAITAVGKDNGNRYAADSPEIPIELVTRYYLPGVTPSIDAAVDIPIPSRGTPAQLLGAIFGGATLFIYQVGEKAQYNDTPVFLLTVTQFNPQHLISPDNG